MSKQPIPAALVSLYSATNGRDNQHHIALLFKRLDRLGVTIATQNEVLNRAFNGLGLAGLTVDYY